uniref:Helitron_like_N domain-containing protein n=1 Tax=Macrostomum lignano TaxID=282301 RepID=A0A1I8IZS7_9PLAT
MLDLVNKVTVPPGVICNNCLIKSWLRRDRDKTHQPLGELKVRLRIINSYNKNVDIIILDMNIKAELVPKNRDYYAYERNAILLAAMNEYNRIISDVANSFV